MDLKDKKAPQFLDNFKDKRPLCSPILNENWSVLFFILDIICSASRRITTNEGIKGCQRPRKNTANNKVEKILKDILDSIQSPSPSVKIQIVFAWGVKTKHCWALSTNFWKQKVCWHHLVMFCLMTSRKLSR